MSSSHAWCGVVWCGVACVAQDAMDEAGEAPENMEALKTAVMEKLSEWYMRNHGVGTMANVEDMCTLLQVQQHLHYLVSRPGLRFCLISFCGMHRNFLSFVCF